MRMPQHPVDDILNQRPRKQSAHESQNQYHIVILGPRRTLSNAANGLHRPQPLPSKANSANLAP
jgi:hypothetical protein